MILTQTRCVLTESHIDHLESILSEQKELAAQRDKDNYDKDVYSNPYKSRSRAIQKLIRLVELCGVVAMYPPGKVLINDKFVVSLGSNKWRVRGKKKWYPHKDDLSHFVDNYVFADNKT